MRTRSSPEPSRFDPFRSALSWLRPMRVPGPPVAERVGDRIVRHFASAAARDARMPSIALESPLPSLGPALEGFTVHPRFERIRGRWAARLAIDPGTSLYGTGEVAGPLLRDGQRVTLWNLDAYDYDDCSSSLYQSHPWVLAVRADGTAYGTLFDTVHRATLDLSNGILAIADGAPFPVIVVERDSPQEVVRELSNLTGRMPMPPRWAVGYHQCRYSYTPASRVLEIADGLRERGLPCDVLWLDIDYMDRYRCFTWHPEHFAEPERLLGDLKARGFHAVAIVDPGIPAEPGDPTFESGEARNAWIRMPDGRPFVGKVWPGRCHFPDFTRRDVRSWWAERIAELVRPGLDGIWNDMNEPAVFETPTRTLPTGARHLADFDLGGPGDHARYHNVYGMLMARASREGLQAARPERRPFVLTRSNHLGGQRHAATWTGDNAANWTHLAQSIPMVLNLGLSGQPFAGPDIGGFSGNGDAALFARWMGIGALLPFSRGHTAKGTRDKEPWAFGSDVERTCRRALERRYRLLPYLYTLFREASVTGLPVARPLFFADPADPKLRGEHDAFLLGGDVLVVASVTPDRDRTPAWPRGLWRPFDLELGDRDDADLPRLAIRGGAIVPLGPVVAHSGVPIEQLELLISLDERGCAEGWLYEDEGDGFAYQSGGYALTRFVAERVGDDVRVTWHRSEGDWIPPARSHSARLLLAGREAIAVPTREVSLLVRARAE